MRIVKFMGGLGNQMFQEAFLIALQNKTLSEVYIDLSDYKRKQQHNGYELERVFGIIHKEADLKDISQYTCISKNNYINKIYTKLDFLRPNDIKERHSYKYQPKILSNAKEGYYDGYWQCYKYFDEYRDEIIKRFVFSEFEDEKNKLILRILESDVSCVSIHIRRGDYLTHPMYKGLCDIDYYKSAITTIKNLIKDKIHFLVFSNDIEWCKHNIINLIDDCQYTIVDWNKGSDSYRDMQLMSLCKGNIIANSSFSWWSAYLNRNNDAVIIAPKRWVNQPLNYRIQMPTWILI